MSAATSTRSPSPASSTSSTPEEEEYTYQADQHPSLTASQERAAMAAHSSSRAQSPVAPASSPLAPKPNSSDGRPAPDLTLQLTEIIELEDTPLSGPRTNRKDVAQLLEGDKVLLSQSAELTEPEHTTNMLPTPDEVSGLTSRKDLSSIPQSEHGKVIGDRNRATEFEEASSCARLTARVSAEQSLDEQSPKRASKADSKAPATSNLESESQDGEQAVADGLPKQAGQETCAPGGVGEQGAAEPKDESDVTPSRSQAEWVGAAVLSCKTNKKNPLIDGNVLVILDAKSLDKCCLISADDLLKASKDLGKLGSSCKEASRGCVSENGLSGLLVLSGSTSNPQLFARPLDQSLEDLSEPERILTPAEEVKARRQSADSAKVKPESSQEVDPSKRDLVDSKTNWCKAYESFFRIIAGKRAHGLPRNDPAFALPQIEGIINIAQEYAAIGAVQIPLHGLFFDYVGSGTFWELLAKEPVRFIKIGIALKNLHVYEEAFKHLVGISSSFKAGRKFAGLPDDVQAIINRRSFDLYNSRRDAIEALLLISLPVPKKNRSDRPSEYPSQVVSQHEGVNGYNTVNLFRDWLSAHIGYLLQETSRPPAPFYLCDHEHGCDTIAGLFRLLHRGSDAYLPFDKFWEDFANEFVDGDDEDACDDVKKALAALKARASEIVARLVESTLRLSPNHELDYLTRVAVGQEEVPWNLEDEDGMDVD